MPTVAASAGVQSLRPLFRDPAVEHVAVIDERQRAVGVVSRVDFQLRTTVESGGAVLGLLSPGVIAVAGDLSLGAASALLVRRGLEGLLVPVRGGYACLFAADVVRWVAKQSGGA